MLEIQKIHALKEELNNWVDCCCSKCINTQEKFATYDKLIKVLEKQIEKLNTKMTYPGDSGTKTTNLG